MAPPTNLKGITLSFEGSPDVPKNHYVYYKGTQRIDGVYLQNSA